ncbi:MAG TPA: S8 family serine peptidase [Blastocatellia bacterium]|nr:S8 family serine peptidase [Blastocatellia bacterium]
MRLNHFLTKSCVMLVTATLVLAAAMVTPPMQPVAAQTAGKTPPQSSRPASKLSDDLQKKVGQVAPNAEIPVIMQAAGTPSKSLQDLMKRQGGKIKRLFTNFNAVSFSLPAGALAALAARDDVVRLSLDRTTQVSGHVEEATGTDQVRSYAASPTGQLDGTGIGIAILDSGIYQAHHEFLDDAGSSRIIANIDFTGEGRTDDLYGHGTHVASLAAGNNHVAGGTYTGLAPNAKIINVRVLDSMGRGSMSATIAGIDWCITNKNLYNIRVMNLSLGTVAVESYRDDPLCVAVRRAVDAGIVVCAAAGNLGKDDQGNRIYGTIHSPGTEPSALTVGAINTLGTAKHSDDQVASYSSCGPTRGFYTDAAGVRHFDNLIKPDLVAPGNKLIDAKAPGNRMLQLNPALDTDVSPQAEHGMMKMSGTSMATPVVAGAVALLLQRNPALTPNLVKAVLEYTADSLPGASNIEQGAGELNVEGAVRLAGLVRTDVSNLTNGAPLLTGPAPAPQTTIDGETFDWASWLVERYNVIYGPDLLTQYQGIYGQNVLLCDGVLISNGCLLADGTLIANNTMLSEGVLIADGGVLLNGSLLADGVMLSDGVLLTDGVLLSDSVLCDSLPATAQSALAQSALGGDQTASMPVVRDHSTR